MDWRPLDTWNQPTCNYSHDDLSRVDDVNCGTAWQQAFGFDAFGNITKTGSQSFTPTYSAATNRINGGGYSTSYDANGNETADGLTLSSIGWNAENNPVSISNGTTTVSVVYDALGRAVENGSGSSYTEIVYGPDGSKLALMNGSSLVKAFVSLPGGGQAVYNSSGLAYYRHGDWLGSSRLATTPSRGVYFDGAYAPYGENYAGTGTTDLSFTGQNQDTMSGLYDFMFRRYNPVQGRWISPDPAGLASVNPSNPQTWNRYGYVNNNPLIGTDPSGLGTCLGPNGPYDCGHFENKAPADDSDDDVPFWYVFVFQGGPWQTWQSMVCMLLGDCHSSQLMSTKGGGPSASVPAKRTPPPPAQNKALPPCPHGFGAGITTGAAGQAGIIASGVVAEGSLSGGIFHNSNSGTTVGGVASGGVTAYAGSHTVGTPQQGKTLNDRFVVGEFLGAGVGLFFTNAGSAAAMASTKGTLSINLGFEYAASFNISGGGKNGIWAASINFGLAPPGVAASVQNTASEATGTQCR